MSCWTAEVSRSTNINTVTGWAQLSLPMFPPQCDATGRIFGPVLVCLQVATLDDAISLVNQNHDGNGTCIFTLSGSTARYFQSNIDVGQVEQRQRANPGAPSHVLLHGLQREYPGRRELLWQVGCCLLHANQNCDQSLEEGRGAGEGMQDHPLTCPRTINDGLINHTRALNLRAPFKSIVMKTA